MHHEWWRSTRGEKKEFLKGGVDKQRWQQEDKCSMHAGWMNNTRRCHDSWSNQNFANTRDPTMLAAASDTAVGKVVEFRPVLHTNSKCTFGVRSAYTHAWEDELVFWNRHRKRLRNTVIVCGGRTECLWTPQGCKVVEGALCLISQEQSVQHSTTCVRRMA